MMKRSQLDERNDLSLNCLGETVARIMMTGAAWSRSWEKLTKGIVSLGNCET